MIVDLKKLVGEVAKYAPALGTAIGGPPGAVVGGLVSAVASAFGLKPDAPPDAISDAIKSDPEAAAKLAKIQADKAVAIQQINADRAVRELQEETRQVVAVNATMQTEAKSEHWPQWAWRPYWGFISGTAFGVVCVFVCYLAYQAIIKKDASALGNIPLIIGAFTTPYTVPGAICGITAWGRNKVKTQQAPTMPPI